MLVGLRRAWILGLMTVGMSGLLIIVTMACLLSLNLGLFVRCVGVKTLLCLRNFSAKGSRLAWMLLSTGGCLRMFLRKMLRCCKFGGKALCNIQFEPENLPTL